MVKVEKRIEIGICGWSKLMYRCSVGQQRVPEGFWWKQVSCDEDSPITFMVTFHSNSEVSILSKNYLFIYKINIF